MIPTGSVLFAVLSYNRKGNAAFLLFRLYEDGGRDRSLHVLNVVSNGERLLCGDPN